MTGRDGEHVATREQGMTLREAKLHPRRDGAASAGGLGTGGPPVSMPFPLRHPLRPEPEPGQGGKRTAACTPLTLQGFSGSG